LQQALGQKVVPNALVDAATQQGAGDGLADPLADLRIVKQTIETVVHGLLVEAFLTEISSHQVDFFCSRQLRHDIGLLPLPGQTIVARGGFPTKCRNLARIIADQPSTIRRAARLGRNRQFLATLSSGGDKQEEIAMGFGRGLLFWLLGVPLPIIILLALFWHN